MKSNPIIIKKQPNLLSSVGGGSGRAARVPIPGVFPSSSRFGEQVVKFRVPLLDNYIGGGVPIGSICVIRDEFPSKFGDMLLKSFIADGACYNHHVYIATGGSASPLNFSKDLPSIKKSSGGSGDSSSKGGDEGIGGGGTDLKIAWRYGHQSNPGGGGGSGGGRHGDQNHHPSFDFGKKTSVEDLGGGKNLHLSKCCSDDSADQDNIGWSLPPNLETEKGNAILKEIVSIASNLELDGPKAPQNVLRIGITHLDAEVVEGANFMQKLRSVVQCTNSCAVIILGDSGGGSSHQSKLGRCKVEHLADIVISLQSVIDQKRRNELGGVDGICNILKLAGNHTLKIVEAPKDIGFSFKKKKLHFHELHLPPEGENTTQRETSSSSPVSSCGSTFQGKRIDF